VENRDTETVGEEGCTLEQLPSSAPSALVSHSRLFMIRLYPQRGQWESTLDQQAGVQHFPGALSPCLFSPSGCQNQGGQVSWFVRDFLECGKFTVKTRTVLGRLGKVVTLAQQR
jgi:hypothetical protein